MNPGDLYRAQRWHMTDHGPDRKPALRDTKFRISIPEPEPGFFSSCFHCCQRCDPDRNPARPNPYWTPALTVLEGLS